MESLRSLARLNTFSPINFIWFLNIIKLAAEIREKRTEVPLRAKSVCLTQHPRSQHGRNTRSADSLRCRFSDKQYIHKHPSTGQIKRPHKVSNVVVKGQKRKVIEKIPYNVSIQNLSIPIYADNSDSKHSTSDINDVKHPTKLIDNRNKYSNLKQAGEKKLCQTVCRKETENKLLLQISEAEQVTDFERILNSNAILWQRARGLVWRGSVAAHSPSTSLLPRPRSFYSLRTVSQAYQKLYREHEESLQQLIDKYRQETDDERNKATTSLLENNWYENLQGLSEFYEDDQLLQKEIATITDRIIAEEIRGTKEQSTTKSNFSVNLAGLIDLQVTGEGVSPTFRDDLGPSPDVEREGCDDKEWLAPSMSANSDKRHLQNVSELDCLVENLNTIQIVSDANVPTITFSNCCEARSQLDVPNNTEVVIHLTVPSIDSIQEARPPMM